MRSAVSPLIVLAAVVLTTTLASAQSATDFGDAPISYGEVSATNINDNFYLGACADSEVANLPSANADGDDLDFGGFTVGTCVDNDDEDGVTFNTDVVPGQTATMTVTAGPLGCALNAWYDFNIDGDFADADEHIIADQDISQGQTEIDFAVPASAVQGTTFARFRCCTDIPVTACASPTGAQGSGEVEDHQIATVPVELQTFTIE